MCGAVSTVCLSHSLSTESVIEGFGRESESTGPECSEDLARPGAVYTRSVPTPEPYPPTRVKRRTCRTPPGPDSPSTPPSVDFSSGRPPLLLNVRALTLPQVDTPGFEARWHVYYDQGQAGCARAVLRLSAWHGMRATRGGAARRRPTTANEASCTRRATSAAYDYISHRGCAGALCCAMRVRCVLLYIM